METSANTMYIAKDCNINGNINSTGNVTIDGQVEGTISIQGDLVIGEGAKIRAEIEADNVEIRGDVQGKMTVRSLLSIFPTGSLVGDIMTKNLKIERGAKFMGTCTHSDEKADEKESSEGKFGFKPIIYNRLAK